MQTNATSLKCTSIKKILYEYNINIKILTDVKNEFVFEIIFKHILKIEIDFNN